MSLRLAESEYSWDLYEMQWEGTMTDKPSTPIEAQAKAAGHWVAYKHEASGHCDGMSDLYNGNHFVGVIGCEDGDSIVAALNAADRALPASGEAAAPEAWMVWRDVEGESREFFLTEKAARENACLGVCTTHMTPLYRSPAATPRAEADADAIVERDVPAQREIALKDEATEAAMRAEALAAENKRLREAGDVLYQSLGSTEGGDHDEDNPDCQSCRTMNAWREARRGMGGEGK